MPLVLADRVQETTTTTGTGTITLAGAVAGYQSFSVIGNGNTTYYCVTSGANWEVGVGTYTASGTTLARTTILASSAAGAAITLAGTSIVFCVYPAGRAVYGEADGSVILNVNSSTNALRITQTGSGNALVVEDSTNPDATPFVIDANGNVGIGATPVTGVNIYNAKNITGAVTSRSNFVSATIQSDVTNVADGFVCALATSASAFTVSNVRIFAAGFGTLGAGSTITNLYGYQAGGTLLTATNNFGFYAADTSAITAGKTSYGFRSDINSPTGGGTTWGFYAQGTANNYFNGNVSIGTTGSFAKVTVRSDSAAAISDGLLLQNAGGAAIGTGTALYFDTNGNGTIRAASIQSAQVTAGNNADLRFFTAAGATPTEKMRIDSSGNVGIGNSSPSWSLDILRSQDSATVARVNNANVSANAASIVQVANTGTAGATFDMRLYSNTGAPYAQITTGSSVTGVYYDATLHVFRSQGGSERMRIDGSTGNVGIGRTPTVSLDVNGAMALRAPSTVNAATYTVAATDSSLRFTTTNCTVTLPAAASFTGRILYLNTITANSVTSASSNVIPLGSNTAGTAIFPATAGKFAMIQSDGTNWITMMAN